MPLINSKRYVLKDNILSKLNKKFEDALDHKEILSKQQMQNLIEEIIKNSIDTDVLMPFDKNLIPTGDNLKGSKELFYNKKYYERHAFPKSLGEGSQDILTGDAVDDMSQYQGEARNIFPPFNSIDFNTSKMLYGRIDTHNRPIYPSKKFLRLVPETKDVMLLDFVCEALSDMLERINTLKDMKKISQKSVYYNFNVKSGWVDPIQGHHETMKSIFEGFILNIAKSGSDKIKDFSDYTREFVTFMDQFLLIFPITRSNLQLRRATNPRISGLSFEIANLRHDEDRKKYEMFILDEHFIQMQKIANAFGFMVDKNAPWRFVADLESPQMRYRMAEKGYDTLQEMFDACYFQTHFFEIEAIKTYFLSFYDSYVEQYPYYTTTIKYGDGSKSKLMYRKARIENDFTERKLIEMYFYIRAKEANKDWNQEYFDLSVEEAFRVFEHYGLKDCLNHIHDKTCLIVGNGANAGIKTKKEENGRIFYTHQSYNNGKTFTIKL